MVSRAFFARRILVLWPLAATLTAGALVELAETFYPRLPGALPLLAARHRLAGFVPSLGAGRMAFRPPVRS